MVNRTLAKRFAELYVNHPGMRGDWHKVAFWLGFKMPPPMDDANIAAAIDALGGKVPKLLASSTLAEHSEVRDPIDAEYIASEPEEARTPEDWAAMAERLKPVMAQVAATGGYVVNGLPLKATAAQVAALKVIFDRAEGRVHEKASAKAAPAGVVLLPGDGFICPKCGYDQTQS